MTWTDAIDVHAPGSFEGHGDPPTGVLPARPSAALALRIHSHLPTADRETYVALDALVELTGALESEIRRALKTLASQGLAERHERGWRRPPTSTPESPMKTPTYGETLRARRTAIGLSQSALGRRCGFTSPQATVSSLETGRAQPTDEQRAAIESALTPSPSPSENDPGALSPASGEGPVCGGCGTRHPGGECPPPSAPPGSRAAESGAGSAVAVGRLHDYCPECGVSEWATRATTAERERDDARALLRDVEWVYHGVADELTERVRRAEKAEQAVRGIYNDLARYLPQVGTETLEDRVREAAAAQTELDALREALSCAPDETLVARARVVRGTNDELLRLLTEARTRIAELEALRATAPTDALTVEQIAERCGLVRGEDELGPDWRLGGEVMVYRYGGGWYVMDDVMDVAGPTDERSALLAYARGVDLTGPAPQPAPSGGEGDCAQELIDHVGPSHPLHAALVERRALGIAQYGQPLRRGDGRDEFRDLREELLDAAIYAWRTRCVRLAVHLLDLAADPVGEDELLHVERDEIAELQQLLELGEDERVIDAVQRLSRELGEARGEVAVLRRAVDRDAPWTPRELAVWEAMFRVLDESDCGDLVVVMRALTGVEVTP